MTEAKKTGLELLREPFPAHQISKLPKPTKQQTDAVKADFKVGIRCQLCGAWHHPQVVHLDYVGHAALTNRLLDADPAWTWEPAAIDSTGHPIMDSIGGMWIRLTVCGVTRLGYGHPDGKDGGNAVKEVIGDALRNAAMRFGAALDLWHKGDLHGDDDAAGKKPGAAPVNMDRSKDAGGVISGPREVFSSLPPDWQTWLKDFAPTVDNAFEQQGAAVAQAMIVDAKLDNECIAGLYSLLSSKARSALKALPRIATV